MDNITFIKGRTQMGITRPFVCQSETGQWFVVKTTAMMPIRQLLAELIGSTLAYQIGLPCPQISLVKFSSFIQQISEVEWRSHITSQTAIASPYQHHCIIAKSLQALDPTIFDEIAQKWLYMFDHWILNSDRTASRFGTGNINLLFDEEKQQIIVIDHNLAFDEKADFSQHIFSPQNRQWRLTESDKQKFTKQALSLLSKFDQIYQNIPDDWFPFNEEEYQKIDTQINQIKSLLMRINETNYWNNIK